VSNEDEPIVMIELKLVEMNLQPQKSAFVFLRLGSRVTNRLEFEYFRQ
jgi:hypothetical protein